MALVKAITLLLVLWNCVQLQASPAERRLDDPWERKLFKRLNSVTFNDQYGVKIASIPDGTGGFVAVWQSVNQAGSNSGDDLVMARFDRNLKKIGFEVPVTPENFDRDQDSVSLSVSREGVIVLTYEHATSSNRQVRAAFFDSRSITKLRDPITIISGTDNSANPSVAALDNGNFALAYTDTDGNTGVDGYVINRNGQNALSGKIGINSRTDRDQKNPKVATLQGGSFVVIYESDYGNSEDFDIVGQIFSQNGQKLGNEFIVNSFRFGTQINANVAKVGNGFVVVWQSGNQISGNEIYAQRYDNFGFRQGLEFRANTGISGSHNSPTVAEINAGFAVIWTDNSKQQVVCQRFDLEGRKKGEVFRVSDKTVVSAGADALGLPNGDLVVVYEVVSSQTFSKDIVGSLLTPCDKCKKEQFYKYLYGGIAGGVGTLAVVAVVALRRRKNKNATENREPRRYVVTNMMSGSRTLGQRARNSFNDMLGFNNRHRRRDRDEAGDDSHSADRDRKDSKHYDMTSIPPPNGWKWTLRPAYRGKEKSKRKTENAEIDTTSQPRFPSWKRQSNLNPMLQEQLPEPVSTGESVEYNERESRPSVASERESFNPMARDDDSMRDSLKDIESRV